MRRSTKYLIGAVFAAATANGTAVLNKALRPKELEKETILKADITREVYGNRLDDSRMLHDSLEDLWGNEEYGKAHARYSKVIRYTLPSVLALSGAASILGIAGVVRASRESRVIGVSDEWPIPRGGVVK